MNNSDNRRWALFGPLAVALWIVGIILLNKGAPASHATGTQILAWYHSDTTKILFGGWIFALGCLSFITFMAGVRMRLVEAVGPASMLPGLAFVGGALTAAFGMLTAAVDVCGAINKSDISPSTAAALHNSTDVFFVGVELAAILPLAAVAIAAWRTRVLPRWWAAFGAFVAVVLVIGPIGWLAVLFGVPLWTLGTSLFVLLRSRERWQPAAAAA